MAHHKATIKAIRQTEKRTARNKSRISRIRTFMKKVRLAIDAKDKKTAATALKTAQIELDKGVSKGVIKRETASRKLSRLNSAVKKIA